MFVTLVHTISSGACKGDNYEETFSFEVPSEITFGSTTYMIDGASINSISGLPNGLSYSCISCSAGPGGEVAIKVSGTIDDVPGEYVLGISASASVNGSTVGISLPDPAFPESYISITVEDCGDNGNNCNLSTSTSSTDVSCAGDRNGSASVSYTGAKGSVSIVWSTGATGSSIANLSPGSYGVTVTDSEGCSSSESVNIGVESDMDVDVVFATISTPNNGEILVNVTGGQSPYTYEWNNGATGGYISDLSPGTYVLVVTDVNGCSAAIVVTLELEDECTLSIETTSSDVTCAGFSNGKASVTVSGSINYDINWSTGSTSNAIANLSAGNYSVTVKDASGCEATENITIQAPNPLIITEAAVTNTTCNSNESGSVALAVEGGTAPYFFFWSNGATTPAISSLSAGNYEVSIGDSNGCTLVANYDIAATNTDTSACGLITYDNIGADDNTLQYQFSIADTSLNGVWQAKNAALDTIVFLGDSTTIEYTFPSEGTYTVSYTFEHETGCEVFCEFIVEAFLASVENSECSFIEAKYIGNWGALRYEFTIGDTSLLGKWTAFGSIDQQLIGMGRTNTVAYTFPKEDTYTICFNHADEQGKLVECCKDIYLFLPEDANLANTNQAIRNLQAMPNPFNASTTLQFNVDQSSMGSIEIWSMDGALKYQKQYLLEQGFNQISLNESFQAGMYLLKVRNSNWIATKRLIVTK